jgi:exodeoxyribonuclease VII small subunit
VSESEASENEEVAGGENLETRLKRLEEILGRLEADDVPLEEAMGLFEEGVGHVRAAGKVLAAAELRVEELLADGGMRELSGSED